MLYKAGLHLCTYSVQLATTRQLLPHDPQRSCHTGGVNRVTMTNGTQCLCWMDTLFRLAQGVEIRVLAQCEYHPVKMKTGIVRFPSLVSHDMVVLA